MVNSLVLSCPAVNGRIWEARFNPNDGLCLSHLQYGQYSLLHANGGRLIGPHYGRHRPILEDNPLYHGSARYASWKIIDSTEHAFRAEITADTLWQERKLGDWQGQKFKMTYEAHLSAHGLTIACSVVGETDTLIGIDYPWVIPAGVCYLRVADNERGSITEQTSLHLSTDPWHKVLNPAPTPLGADMALVTPQYEIQVSYSSPSRENCCCIDYQPADGYVAIQPLTAQDPLHPNLTVSSLHVAITFVELMR